MPEYLETHKDVLLGTVPGGYCLVAMTAEGYIIEIADQKATATPDDWQRARTVAASERAIHLLRAFLADGMSGQLRSEMRKVVRFVDERKDE